MPCGRSSTAEEVGYLNHISRFRMLCGAAAAFRRLNEVRMPGGDKSVRRAELLRVIARSRSSRAADVGTGQRRRGGDAVYYCPHVSADACACRKPKTRIAEQAGAGRLVGGGDRSGERGIHRASPVRKHFFVPAGHAEDELAWHAKAWPRQPDFVAADRSMAVEWIF